MAPPGRGRDAAEPAVAALHATTASPIDKVLHMLGLNGVEVYGLDGDALHKVAQRINAPTVAEVQTPIDAIPEGHGMWAFRQFAAFG